MTTGKKLLAIVAGLWLAMAGPAMAIVPASLVDVVTSDAASTPGNVAYPTISLDISGFAFDSFTLDLVYPLGLTFVPSLTHVAYTASPSSFDGSLTTMPGYAAGPRFEQGGNWHEKYVSFSLVGPAVTSPLLLTAAFQVDNAAAPGSYQILFSGQVSTGPVVEEPDFNGSVNVSVVPEPETWLLWFSGIGLLVTRAARRRNKATRSRPVVLPARR